MKVMDYIIESCDMQNAKDAQDYAGFALAYAYTVEKMWCRPADRGGKDQIFIGDLPSLITYVHGGTPWVDFRCQPATFANGNRTIVNDRAGILRQVKLLIDNQHDMTAAEFYQRGVDLHPWDDGNGRVFSLLFNFKNGTIMDPIHPPEYQSVMS